MAVSTEKISVHSLADLKNTTDDAIPAYLNSLTFTQSHILSDTRLALGYTAFAICAATFYWDYQFGFEATKSYTTLAVILYTLLNGALTYWIWGIEKGSIYIGTNKNGDKIEISSRTEKYVPIYNLTITTYGKGEKVGKTIKVKKPFTQWFDRAGRFHALPFQQFVASNVGIVGEADPGKVVKDKKKEKKGEVEAEPKSMDDKWASLLAESSGVSLDDISGATPASTPGRKKRGRKA